MSQCIAHSPSVHCCRCYRYSFIQACAKAHESLAKATPHKRPITMDRGETPHLASHTIFLVITNDTVSPNSK